MAFLAALHYWFPKMFGRMYPEGWGMVAAAFIVLGFNATFIPQFLLGNAGMPRRYYMYPERFTALNVASTAGASLLAFGFIIIVVYLSYALVRGKKAPSNPWDSRGYEWLTTSPPPKHNFDETPLIDRDPYTYQEPGRGGRACRHLTRTPRTIRTSPTTSTPSRSRTTRSGSACGCSSGPRCCCSPACSSATRSTGTSITRPSTRPRAASTS